MFSIFALCSFNYWSSWGLVGIDTLYWPNDGRIYEVKNLQYYQYFLSFHKLCAHFEYLDSTQGADVQLLMSFIIHVSTCHMPGVDILVIY
jgi:hypothetical protein